MTTKKIEKWSGTFADWLVEAKRLRAHFESSQLDFVRHLYAGELNRDMWDEGGYPSFAAAIERNTLIDVGVYAACKKTIEFCEAEVVNDVGFNGAVAIGKVIPEKRLRAQDAEAVAGVTAVRSFSKRNSVAISQRRATSLIRRAMPSLRVARTARKATEISALKKEVASLRKQKAALEAEVRTLKARLAVHEKGVKRPS